MRRIRRLFRASGGRATGWGSAPVKKIGDGEVQSAPNAKTDRDTKPGMRQVELTA